MQFQTVAKVDEIPEAAGRGFVVQGRLIAVFRDNGQFYALEDFCPHQGAELHTGAVEAKTVTCLHHGWRFSLETGCWLSAKRNRVDTFPVQIVGDEIQVGIPVP